MQEKVLPSFVDATLQSLLDRAIAHLVEQFGDRDGQPGVHPDTLAITAIDLGARPTTWAHHNGDRPIYPASIIKLFYVVASYVWEDAGKLTPSAELDRSRYSAIVHSSNDATSYLLDILTGTTSGPELSPIAFQLWQDRRNVLNRYFHALGLPGNFCQKTWTDGPYGRDRQSYELNNRNRLTTNGTAWLMHSIVTGQAVSPERSQAILGLMKRDLDPATYIGDPDNQIQGFLGEALPLDAQLWSKAGETSFSRHDCALIQLPDRPPYILVAFGDGPEYFNNWKWLPALSQFWLEQMQPRSTLAV
ncbi:serine hydrolase [Synechococcus sp. PCC 7336]|uniref:serine hydrolase n=1 Tax=Synechococcus sp. PCC 7336 TaxID=195250 RepID=UPI00034AF56F|nr:serine hydrolase [Synechococcus sp. PCC 7336]